jgi:hypothetical protein
MIKSACLSAAVLLSAATAFAEYVSPPAETSATIAGKRLAIKYCAPSMHGRKIFGGIEPYDKIWRAGANDATAFHTDAALDIKGLAVPKGDYTLFVWLDRTQWQLIVSKAIGEWGLNYPAGQDLGRVKMDMSKPASPIDKYKMTLSAVGGNQGKLQLEWETTIASVPFTVK